MRKNLGARQPCTADIASTRIPYHTVLYSVPPWARLKLIIDEIKRKRRERRTINKRRRRIAVILLQAKKRLPKTSEDSKGAFSDVVHRTEVVESGVKNEELEEALRSLGIEEVVYYEVL